MSTLIIGFSIGFLGSWHCLGMCGPLVLALPYGNSSSLQRFVKNFLYSAGRTLTYMTIGLVLSIVGQQFAWSGLQNALSVSIGVLLVLSLSWPIFYKRATGLVGDSRWLGLVKRAIQNQFQRRERMSFFLTGGLNGLLPCGMVYLASASSLAFTQTWEGITLMFGFGLGTWPMMLGVAFLPALRVVRRFDSSRWLTPAMLVFGVIMVWRGLALDFPDIPQLGHFNPKSLTICQ